MIQTMDFVLFLREVLIFLSGGSLLDWIPKSVCHGIISVVGSS